MLHMLPCPCLLPYSDADLSLAASSIIKGGFSYSGQRCTAVKVVLVVADVADELVKMVSRPANPRVLFVPAFGGCVFVSASVSQAVRDTFALTLCLLTLI